MKKFIKNNIIGFIIGGIIFTFVGVYAGAVISGSSISYSNSTSKLTSTNVQGAIDEIAEKTKQGDATAVQILSGKKALVGGTLVTGSMANKGAWTSTPTEKGKVTIPAGYHDGTGYVDTSKVYDAGFNACLTSAINATFSINLNFSGRFKYDGIVYGNSGSVSVPVNVLNGNVQSTAAYSFTATRESWSGSYTCSTDITGTSATNYNTYGVDYGNWKMVVKVNVQTTGSYAAYQSYNLTVTNNNGSITMTPTTYSNISSGSNYRDSAVNFGFQVYISPVSFEAL